MSGTTPPSIPPPDYEGEPRPTLLEPVRRDEPPWPAWTAPAAIGVGFAVGLAATIVVGIAGAVGGSSLTHPSPAVSLIEDLVFDLSFVGTALYFASRSGRPRPEAFGFRRVGLELAMAGFCVSAIAYYVVTAAYASTVHLHGSDKLPSELGVSNSTAALVGAAVFVCVIAPVLEEFFFRGFLFGALRRWHVRIAGRDLGTLLAAIITGIVFGLAHTGSASSQYLIPLGFLGFVLCLLRWRTGSLYPGIALHSINNSLALGINQLHWNAPEIGALLIGALLVVGTITLPLAGAPLQAPA